METQIKSASSLAWTRMKGYLALYGAALIFILLLPKFFYREVLFLIPIGALMIHYAIVYSRALSQFMEQFAKENGYSFSKTGDPAALDLKIQIFKRGHSRALRNLLSGKIADIPLRIFDYQYSIGEGKHRQTFFFTFFELKFETDLPSLFLKTNFLPFATEATADNKFAGTPKLLNIGEPFDSTFNLYVPEGYEIEALTIFTPDIMSYLLDFKETFQGFCLEFSEDRLYIYTFGQVSRRDILNKMQELAAWLSKNLAPTLKLMKAGLKSQEEYLRSK